MADKRRNKRRNKRRHKPSKIAVLKKINEVEEFISQLRSQSTETLPEIPYDTIPYGEALICWEKLGKNPKDMFSSEDQSLLQFKQALTARFGLEILTPTEAEERKKRHNYQEFKVTGLPSQTKLLN